MASLLLLTSLAVKAESGYLVVGLDEQSMQWQLFLQSDRGQWRLIKTDDEPRTPDYEPLQKQTVYADSEGSIRSIKDGVESTVFESGVSYKLTQPVFAEQSNVVYMVALKDGTSVDTDIVQGDISTGKLQLAVGQRSAQFEPFVFGNYVYYSSVSCVPPGCHRIIEDIWRINPIGRRAEQLTRANAISREPVVHGSDIYFISDLSGQFRLHTLKEDKSVPLTTGVGIDSSPGITKSGDVVFIQRTRSARDVIKKWSKKTGELVEIAGPPGVIKLRDLGVW